MRALTKCELFAYTILAVVSVLEVFLFCRLFNTGFENWIILSFVSMFVIVFNGSVWWFRSIYDRALSDNAKKG